MLLYAVDNDRHKLTSCQDGFSGPRSDTVDRVTNPDFFSSNIGQRQKALACFNLAVQLEVVGNLLQDALNVGLATVDLDFPSNYWITLQFQG
ncbi:hypothetical protein TNCV_3894721 [Trichonephila clavipes]|nr:hypothetical protein TNCV_3894721 [Trichonephila clavipes]